MTDRILHRHSIDVVYHRLIGREDEACVKVWLIVFRQTSHRLAWQQVLIVLTCLIHQLCSVCKEQDVLNPVVIGEQFAERDTYTSFARTCCKYEQSTSVLLVQPLHKTLDSRLLIVAVCYLIVNGQVGDVRTTTFLQDVLKIVMAMERDNLSVRIAKTIYHLCHIPIGVIDDWSYPIFLLQTIRILYCLFSSFYRTLYCTLCLYNCKWLATFTEQYIVSIASS